MIILFLSLISFAHGSSSSSKWTCAEPSQPWCDPDTPVTLRVQNLLTRLTSAEKIAQLQTTHVPIPGAVSRLGIEEFTTRECLHGVCDALDTTVFPHSISLAATFNPALLKQVAAAIGTEARGLYNDWSAGNDVASSLSPPPPPPPPPPPALACFSPQINIARDPRWGRAQETYGEAPELTGTLAAAYVEGLQGNHTKYVQAIATPKHFNAYGGATSRGMYPPRPPPWTTPSPTEVRLAWRDWVETFLPAFHRVLGATTTTTTTTTTGSDSTMCSYNTLCITDDYHEPNPVCPGPSHGTPACASHGLLTETLRKLWGFQGYVIGDAGAIKFIETDHEYVSTQAAAAAAAVLAGADMALGGGCQNTTNPPGCLSLGALPAAEAQGLVNISDVDVALGRVLRSRFRLGLMDNPKLNPFSSINSSVVNSREHHVLALEAARESIVLLENRRNVLPLSRSLATLAVVGPGANVTLFGNYAGTNHNASTVLSGMHQYMLFSQITYAKGCDTASNVTSGIAAAVAASESSDMTIAVVGLDQSQEYETGTRATIQLPGVQAEFLRSLLLEKVIVIIVGGSAVVLPSDIVDSAAAVLWAGYGGMEAGNAIADVVFGTFNPSGRLPITFYSSDNQLPPFASYDMRHPPGRTFRFLTQSPLWHFGRGLSYTSFVYSDLQLSSSELDPCMPLILRVKVTNVGLVGGGEVVQVYTRLQGTAAEAPMLTLGTFLRTQELMPNETIALELKIEARSLAVVVAKNREGWQWQVGKAMIYVGGRQPRIQERDKIMIKGLQVGSVILKGPSMPCGFRVAKKV